MKNLISIIALSVFLGACGNASKQTEEQRTKAILDSVNTANAINMANLERQKSIDSMNQVVAAEKQMAHHQHVYTNANGSTVTNATTTESKKKMSNKTKGALIGAGTGAVVGAVTGVLVDGKKGEGAVVGGLIGAAAGAGAGTAIGNAKDKKKAASTATVK